MIDLLKYIFKIYALLDDMEGMKIKKAILE
jgi:hypothetical protein